MTETQKLYEKLDTYSQEINKFIKEQDYNNAILILQKIALEVLVEDLPFHYMYNYEELKNKILPHTNYSEYFFPAFVDKDSKADYLVRITNEFQENANTEDLLLTVFIVTYNQENTIAKCIESVINQQTQYKYKIYILEDCSTDRTLVICNEYQKIYPELIEIIAQPKNTFNDEIRHFRKALNTLLNTPYWTVLEGDDFWTDIHNIQAKITFLENNHEYVGVGSNWIEHNMITGEKMLGAVPPKPNHSEYTIDCYSYIHTTARFYRNIVNFSIISYSKKMQDSLIFFEYMLRGTFYFYNKVTSVYNMGTGIWSSQSKEEQKRQNKILYNEFIKRAKEKFEEFEQYPVNIALYLYKNGVKYSSGVSILISEIEENKKQIEENKKQIEENKKQIEENKKQQEENKKQIEENKKQQEENKKQIEEMKNKITIIEIMINKKFSTKLRKKCQHFATQVKDNLIKISRLK